jgi:hypothetical protein
LSAALPLYAWLFASLGANLGFVTPKLWQNQSAFHDIAAGRHPVTIRVPPGVLADKAYGLELYWKLAILTTLLSREDSKQ